MGLIRKFTAASPHLKIALIVAPLLAIGGYIIADLYRPAAKPPAAHRGPGALQVSKNCHLLGDVCELLHREIALNMSARPRDDGSTLVYLSASVPLEGAILASGGKQPIAMETRGTPKRWKALLPYPVHPGDSLSLAVVSGERRYFAEIPASH